MAGRPKMKMPNSERAKQFSSFKALSGLEEALERKRRELGYEERKILSEDDEAAINETLRTLKKGQRIAVNYFNGKTCEDKKMTVTEVREYEQLLIADGQTIRFGNLFSIMILPEEGQK